MAKMVQMVAAKLKNSFKFVIILGPALRKYLYLKNGETIFASSNINLSLFIEQHHPICSLSILPVLYMKITMTS